MRNGLITLALSMIAMCSLGSVQALAKPPISTSVSASTSTTEDEETFAKIERHIAACEADFKRGMKHTEAFVRSGRYTPNPIPAFHTLLPIAEQPLARAACAGWLAGRQYELEGRGEGNTVNADR